MFTSVPASDPFTQAHTALFLDLGYTTGRSYFSIYIYYSYFLHPTNWINAFTADTSQSAPAHFKDILEDLNTPFLLRHGCLSFGKYKVFYSLTVKLTLCSLLVRASTFTVSVL